MARRIRGLEGRVVAVTGGARGIGAAIGRAAAAAGARVALGDIDADDAQATAATLQQASGHALDVTDRAAFTAFLDEAERAHGPVDVLVNNAGIMLLGRFLEEDDEATRSQVEVNLHGVALGMKIAGRRMAQRGHGLIINIASSSSRVAFAGGATYSATKHAVAGLTEAVRAELRGTGVRVAIVLPAPVRTRLLTGVSDLPTVPTLSPEQVADAVIRVIRRPRFQTTVPRSVGVQTRLGLLLPRAVQDRTRRLLGVDRVYLEATPAERAPYEHKVRNQDEGGVLPRADAG